MYNRVSRFVFVVVNRWVVEYEISGKIEGEKFRLNVFLEFIFKDIVCLVMISLLFEGIDDTMNWTDKRIL